MPYPAITWLLIVLISETINEKCAARKGAHTHDGLVEPFDPELQLYRDQQHMKLSAVL